MLHIKKGKVSAVLSIFLFLIVTAPRSSNAQEVREYASPDSLKVGDTFTFTIALNKDQSYDKTIFPDSTHFTSDFEIRSMKQFHVTDFKDSLVYSLQFFGTESSILPELPVVLVNDGDTTTVFTNPVPVNFKSVLRSENEEFRPFKPIFDFAASWWPYILAFMVLAVAGWYLYQLYLKKIEEPEKEPARVFNPEPFRDPLKELASTLKQLRSFSFNSQEDFMRFYINLGDAIRTYFENLYHIPALESTSREILEDLNKRAVNEELVEHTRRVLNEADMVKFAKFTPSESQAKDALDKADAFLKKARQVDRAKVDHLRRRHRSKIEEKRKNFEQIEKEENLV